MAMISRDGMRTSVWQDSVTPYQVSDSTPAGKSFDVAIIDGGITGLSTALKMQAAGKQCIILEAETLCFGTTGGTTAHLNTLLDTPYTTISRNFGNESARQIAEATRNAIDDIRNRIAGLGIDCGFSEADAYLFSQNAEETKELDAICEASQKAGLDISYTARNPIPVPFEKIVNVSGQAKFHPVRYCHALAKAFEELGGIIVQHCHVTGISEGKHITIETSRLDGFSAGAVVIATHIPTGVNLLHLRCTPYRSYAMAVTLKDPTQYPQALVYDLQDPYHYYRTQVIDGQPYLIAGGEDHKTGHEEHAEARFLKLEAHVRKYFDVDAVAYKWSSQYYEPADGLPYIGHLPGHSSEVLVATGFGGNGMVFSQVAAHCLTELVLGRKHPYPFLDPNRIKPVAGFTNFLSQNADVAKQLLKRLFPAEELEVLSALARGEGRVVKIKNETIAFYKDEQGKLHAIDPVCSHLKCHVCWNEAETSWDCPCHGARFSIEGKVLNAPADRDLQQIQFDNLER